VLRVRRRRPRPVRSWEHFTVRTVARALADTGVATTVVSKHNIAIAARRHSLLLLRVLETGPTNMYAKHIWHTARAGPARALPADAARLGSAPLMMTNPAWPHRSGLERVRRGVWREHDKGNDGYYKGNDGHEQFTPRGLVHRLAVFDWWVWETTFQSTVV
jgi:hypothetical protein